MKLEREPEEFKPIIITLESQEELEVMLSSVANYYYSSNHSNIVEELLYSMKDKLSKYSGD